MSDFVLDVATEESVINAESGTIVDAGGGNKSAIVTPPPSKITPCRGEWSSPKNCILSEGQCEYHAKWEYFSRKDEIKFTITTTNTNTWTGIGFSDDHKMVRYFHLFLCLLLYLLFVIYCFFLLYNLNSFRAPLFLISIPDT